MTPGSLLHKMPVGPLSTVKRFTEAPVETQTRLLRRLLQQAASTEWGRRFGFAELAEASDVVTAYQARVPLHQYDALRADVERIRAGAADVMWPGRFKHFAVSSGTSLRPPVPRSVDSSTWSSTSGSAEDAGPWVTSCTSASA